jgi:hypothetical protein
MSVRHLHRSTVINDPYTKRETDTVESKSFGEALRKALFLQSTHLLGV